MREQSIGVRVGPAGALPSHARGSRGVRSRGHRPRRSGPGCGGCRPEGRPAGRRAHRGRRRCNRDRSRPRVLEAAVRVIARAGRPRQAADSPSSFGASRATCSISSLKLTAPALHLDGENLSDHPAQQPLEAGVWSVRQRSNGLFLVGHRAGHGAIRGQLDQQVENADGPPRLSGTPSPQRRHAVVSRGLLSCRTPAPAGAGAGRAAGRRRPRPDPRGRRESGTRYPVPHCSVAAPRVLPVPHRQRRAQPQRHLESRSSLAAEDVQDLQSTRERPGTRVQHSSAPWPRQKLRCPAAAIRTISAHGPAAPRGPRANDSPRQRAGRRR